MTNIGKNIKLARQRKNMTQDELAEKLFVTRQTVSNYELGRTQPDVEMLLAIANALDTDMEALIYGPRRVESAGSGKRLLVQMVLLLVLTGISQVLKKVIQAQTEQYLVTSLVFWNGLLVRPGMWLCQGMILMEALACLTKLAPRNLPRARLALQILSGVYLIAILPLLFWPTKPSAPMNLAYLLLVTTPGHTGLHMVFLLLGIGLWLFRPAPPREQSST